MKSSAVEEAPTADDIACCFLNKIYSVGMETDRHSSFKLYRLQFQDPRSVSGALAGFLPFSDCCVWVFVGPTGNGQGDLVMLTLSMSACKSYACDEAEFVIAPAGGGAGLRDLSTGPYDGTSE